MVLAKGSGVKIQGSEYYLYNGYNGWQEIEFYGVDDPELVKQLVLKKGEIDSFLVIFKICLP